jgi:hypothetical protein
MEHGAALKRFEECYKDRDSVEFPLIFSMCKFSGKTVLEIGSGGEGLSIERILPKAKRVFVTDTSEDMLSGLKQRFGIGARVCRAEKLPFDNKSFDIVFSRWSIMYTELKKSIKEMCRVAKSNVFIILPSSEGDQATIKTIKEEGKPKEREERISMIKKLLDERGFGVKEERRILRFVFPSVDEAFEILMAVDFDNELLDEGKTRLRNILSGKEILGGVEFTQGACFLCGTRME